MFSGLLLQRQAYREAVSCLSSSIANGVDSDRLKVNLAVCRLNLGQSSEAISLAREVVDHEPALPSGWNVLGRALLERGEAEEAEKVLRAGLQLHPDHPALTLHLGHAIKAQGQTDEAMASYRSFSVSQQRWIAETDAMVQRGQFGQAESRYRQLLSAQPGNATALGGLGRLLLRLGKIDAAIDVLNEATRLDPEEPSHRHFLKAARNQPDDRAEPDYVRSLFDAYADDFDATLTGSLEYQVPQKMADLLRSSRVPQGNLLDLGCGTGLLARALGPESWLVDGVDLSEQMLERARIGGMYRNLHLSEIRSFLTRSDQTWSVIVAADVLIYLGAVDDLLPLLSRRLTRPGWFLFSIESTQSADWMLHPASGRYRHSRSYLESSLLRNGFRSPVWVETTIRREYGKAIEGAIGLAEMAEVEQRKLD